MPGTATFVQHINRMNVYRINPPEVMGLKTNHLAVSYFPEADETLVFRTDHNAKPLSYREYAGRKGYHSDAEILTIAGFTIKEA